MVNSRERVLTALEHKEPDRVPIDLGGTPGSTAITAIAYNRLKEYWGIKTGPTRMYDLLQQLAKPDLEVLEKIGADVISIMPPAKSWKPFPLPDGSMCEIPASWPVEKVEDGFVIHERGEVLAKMPTGSYYFDILYAPLANATIEDLDDFTWPAPLSFYKLPDKDSLDIYVAGLKEETEYWYHNSDYALLGTFGGGIFEAAYGLRGFEQFMTDLLLNRAFAEKLLDRLVEANIEYAKRYLEAVDDHLQVIMVGGEDIGTQTGLEISPELYREVIQPRQKRLWQFLKRNSNAHIFVHCCGAIYDIIPDLIDAGADIINPVQISAAGMDSKKLKEEFGDKITFWGGGCDTQYVLPRGSPEEVEQEVKRRIADFAPGGGFVFAQVHNIQMDVPPENIDAMYNAVAKYGTYPISLD